MPKLLILTEMKIQSL